MPKRPSKPLSPTAWIDTLDPEDIAAAYEEATVDVHDEEELQTGLITMAQESLEFPFSAKVMGQVVQIVDSEWAERDAFGLDLIVEKDGGRHRIAARSVELIQPLPKGAVVLAAYLDWRRRF
jgi:hypothetical protein